MIDVIVDEVRQVREELIKRYGGIEGYFKHCQAQDQARTSRAKSRRRKRPARARRKTTTVSRG
jgi:hypothetical protein